MKSLKDELLLVNRRSCYPKTSTKLPNTITHGWTKLVGRYGLKNIHLHDARHSHASLMLQSDKPSEFGQKTHPEGILMAGPMTH
jgi:integrase